MPKLWPEAAVAGTAAELGAQGLRYSMFVFPATEFFLNKVEQRRFDDRFMVVFDVELRNLAVVFYVLL